MKSKRIGYILLTLAGAALVLGGCVAVKTGAFAFMPALPYLMVGVGCGALGHGLGALIQRKVEDRNPEATRAARIEQQDERNIQIRLRAKSRAFDAMGYIYGALLLALALMNTDVTVILLLVGAYLLGYAIMVWQYARLSRQM